MRKFTIFVLLAASAIPAMAAAQDEGGRHWRQQDQQQQSDRSDKENNQREQRQQRNEQRQQGQVERQTQVQQMQVTRQAQVQQVQQQQGDRQARFQQMQAARQQQDQEGQQQGENSRNERMQQYRQQMEQRRAQLGGQQGQFPNGVQGERHGHFGGVPNINPKVVGQPTPENRDARYAAQRQQWQQRSNHAEWSNQWRNDNRYDWRRYRDRHHSIFQIGFYYDPFGYSYNRFGIGSYMYPSYYQSNYWINDPWQYRLPAAYGPYRWIRYHNDALMIDTWTGEVVDVIYGFFW